MQFSFLGDGIFDKLSNRDIIQLVWSTTNKEIIGNNIHEQVGLCVDTVIKTSLLRQSMDNVTCIFIAFQNFQKTIFNTTINNNDLLEIIRQNCSFKCDNDIKLKQENRTYIPTETKLKKSTSIDFNNDHKPKKVDITDALHKLNNLNNRKENIEENSDYILPKLPAKDKENSSTNIPDLNEINDISNIENKINIKRMNNSKREISNPNNKAIALKNKFNFN